MKSLQAAGFSVETHAIDDPNDFAARARVPAPVRTCHTAEIGGYIVEGHVPASAIEKLLREHPKIAGIGVAGMPPGSPGMESANPVAYDVTAWTTSGQTFVYERVRAGSR